MKRLQLNKKIVANLSNYEMEKIHGATLVMNTCDCQNTESCSAVLKCCPPPKEEVYIGG